MKNYKRSLKNFGKGLKSGGVMLAGFAVMPYNMPLGGAIIAKGGFGLGDAVSGNYIENSIMTVNTNSLYNKLFKRKNNYIAQGIPTAKIILESIATEDKMDFLKLQEVNLLLGLDKQNEKSEDITYSTNTHSGNYMMLKQLERAGIIKNLTQKKAGKSTLKLEKMLIGNITEKEKEKNRAYKEERIAKIKEHVGAQSGIINKIKILGEELKQGLSKKTQMFDISFQRTDKEITEQDLIQMDLLKFIKGEDGEIDKSRFNFRKNKDGKVLGIDYNSKYVMSELKKKAREKAIQAGRIVKDKFKDGLDELVRNEYEIMLESQKNEEPKIEQIEKSDERIQMQ